MTDKSIKEQLDASVRQLFELSDAELELELGRRLTETQREIKSQSRLTTALSTGELTTDTETLQALPDVIRKTAHRFLNNFNAQMYSLMCDSADPDNEKIRDAAAAGAESVGFLLSGIFVASFGWLPGIASVIAVIVAKGFASAGYDAVCRTWMEQLRVGGREP